MKIAVTFIALLALAACSPKPAEMPAPASSTAASDFSFDVALTFTPAAQNLLASRKEKVIVSTMYSGRPTAAASQMASEVGEIEFDPENITVDPGDQTVHLTGAAIPADRLKDIDGGKPMVLINVYSARLSGDDNLLNCGIFQDYVSVAQTRPVAISCDVI